MSDYVTTTEGDRVGYDRRGTGPTVIFVAGAGPWRAIDLETDATAEILAEAGVGSIVYDRVGRGESFAPGPISLQREIAAVAALVEVAGGSAVLCGHSSGCSISLYAAAHGIPVDGLALWEAPLAPPGSGAEAWATEIDNRLDRGDLQGALAHYMKDMPAEILEIVQQVPGMIDQAGSLRADAESLVWAESAHHEDLFGAISVATRALIGEQSYDIMLPAAESIAQAIEKATWKRIAGADHSWQPDAMAAELVDLVRTIEAGR